MMENIASVAATVSPINTFIAPANPLPTESTSSANAGAFTSMVSQGLEQVNKQLSVSQTDLQQLANGDANNLHQIMIRLEESRVSFQLMMQVRNRLLESYQEVMRMSV